MALKVGLSPVEFSHEITALAQTLPFSFVRDPEMQAFRFLTQSVYCLRLLNFGGNLLHKNRLKSREETHPRHFPPHRILSQNGDREMQG